MLEKNLLGVKRPGRYLGGEINAWRKSFDSAGVRVALAFPDVYEVGMSHLGLRILYEILNRTEDIMADRVFAPWPDFERVLRAMPSPLRGLESRMPLRAFDLVGFSLQYELSYSNVLTMLDLGGIPLRASERGLGDPFVIGGGPCAFNPEPLADYFDLFVLGEAEQVLLELIDLFREWRSVGGTRREFLERARVIGGIYVPAFFDVSYEKSGIIRAINPFFSDYTRVEKRVVVNMDEDSPIPGKPLVPFLDIVHNRLGLELARGCTRGCRFCQAGYIYRPVRERHPEVVFQRAIDALANSGFEEVSLLSLSTGDYCQIQALLTMFMETFLPNKIAVSFPSMRVGTLTPELMELIKKVRKTGFTLAPEAGSERLRRVINKGIQNEDLFLAAQSAFDLGWRLLKLYFMVGLPTETESDLDALVDLCLQVWHLAKPSRASVNVAISTFVPKPHTPFQWCEQLPLHLIEGRIENLKARLKRPGLRIKWHDPNHSFLEAVFARGDRRLGRVLLHAWEHGARFDGWSECFQKELWDRSFVQAGIDPAFYVNRERAVDEVLPWEMLSTKVSQDYLRREYLRAVQETFTHDCRIAPCSQCGVCDHVTLKPILHDRASVAESHKPRLAPTSGGLDQLYWLHYSKTGGMRFYGQLEISQVFSRALRRAGLPFVMTKGFHPHPKLSFVGALPLGVESLVEEAYLSLSQRLAPFEVQSRLNACLPEGLGIEAVVPVEKMLPRSPAYCVTYEVSRMNPWWTRRVLQTWSRRLGDILEKKTKHGQTQALLGDVLLGVRPISEETLEMDVCEGSHMSFRPMGILQHLLDEPAESLFVCRICKKAQSSLAGVKEGDHVVGARHQR